MSVSPLFRLALHIISAAATHSNFLNIFSNKLLFIQTPKLTVNEFAFLPA
jgi:hypothetical protein